MSRRLCSISLGLFLFIGLTQVIGSENPPETRRHLVENFNNAYQGGHYIDAIRWGLELDRSRPNQPVQQYNLACVYALAGNTRTAIGWLRRSIDNGFRLPDLIENDLDLESIRSDPQWTKILLAVRANAQKYDSMVRRAFVQDPPLIVLPSGHDSKTAAPLIIALHGFGGRPDGYPALWRPAAQKVGAILATPRGLQRLGNAFFWGDLDGARRIVDLTKEYVQASHTIDEENIILTGFSQGGSMAMAIGIQNPEAFAGIIPMAGAYRPETDGPPPAAPTSPKFFFMVGSQDEAKEQCRLAAEDFKDAGYTVDLRIYPGVGHTFPRFTNRELGKALKFILKD